MTIKVGDKVTINKFPDYQRDVLYIHQKDMSKYYVVAYEGDIPTSHREHELTKAPELVDITYCLKGKWFYNCDYDTATHKLILSHLDDEPISVRLEKM